MEFVSGGESRNRRGWEDNRHSALTQGGEGAKSFPFGGGVFTEGLQRTLKVPQTRRNK